MEERGERRDRRRRRGRDERRTSRRRYWEKRVMLRACCCFALEKFRVFWILIVVLKWNWIANRKGTYPQSTNKPKHTQNIRKM